MIKNKKRKHVRSNAHTPKKLVLSIQNEEEAFELIQEKENPLILLIDNIQDPHNLGACLRTASAANVDIVFAPRKNTVGLTETVRTISCGAADYVPYIQVDNLNRTMERLKKAGIWITGTGDSESELIYNIDFTGPTAIAIGSEFKGLRAKIAEKCDFLARIPMQGEVECLNLSVATGISLFEVIRQRMQQ